MRRRMKRFIASALAFTMAFSMVSSDALAAGLEGRNSEPQSVVETMATEEGTSPEETVLSEEVTENAEEISAVTENEEESSAVAENEGALLASESEEEASTASESEEESSATSDEGREDAPAIQDAEEEANPEDGAEAEESAHKENAQKATVYFEDFEHDGEAPEGWLFLDADGDGYNWFAFKAETDLEKIHSGECVLHSESYSNDAGMPLTPDNWAITPAITIPANATLSFYARGVDPDWAAEKLGVYVAYADSDIGLLGDMVLGMTYALDRDIITTDHYVNYVYDLSFFTGATVRIGFRHYDVSDMFRIALDDVAVLTDISTNTISYNANGGSGTMSGETAVSGLPFTLATNSFTAPSDGVFFSSWNTAADGSGTNYFAGQTITVSENITLYAQWAPVVTRLNEGFENGMPEGWSVFTQEGHENYYWKVKTGDMQTTVGAHSGNTNASICHIQSAQDAHSWLVTPWIDLSDVYNPTLDFWFINRDYKGDIDELAVYYRLQGSSGSSAWEELQSITESHEQWTYDSIFLVQGYYTGTIQFAFVSTDHWGWGIGLDDVSIHSKLSGGLSEGFENGMPLDW